MKDQQKQKGSESGVLLKYINDRTLIGALIISICLFVGILAFYGYRMNWQVSRDSSSWGAFGDLVGGVLSPLLSLIAFFGFLYSLNEQRKSSATQSSENIFFQLFKAHTEKVANIYVTYNDCTYSGTKAFVAMNNIFKSAYNQQIKNIWIENVKLNLSSVKDEFLETIAIYLKNENDFGRDPLVSMKRRLTQLTNTDTCSNPIRQLMMELDTEKREWLSKNAFNCASVTTFIKLQQHWISLADDLIILNLFKSTYDIFYQQVGGDIGPYFRNMYYVLFYATQSELQKPDNYIKIFRSQFSHFEHALLLYNGLSSHSKKAFNLIIKKYDLLEGIYYPALPEGIDAEMIKRLWDVRLSIPDRDTVF